MSVVGMFVTGGRRSAFAGMFQMALYLSVFLMAPVGNGACEETCSIGQTPLLLYKTINWWYYSQPEASDRLCGKPISCRYQGNVRVRYDDVRETLTIAVAGGFASMLSLFKECDHCCGPSFLSGAWYNRDYFKNAHATVAVDQSDGIKEVVITRVERQAADMAQAMQSDLMLLVEGAVGGLSNGRIALHTAGDLLRTCGRTSEKLKDHSPITLTVVDTNTGETLLQFGMIWTDCAAGTR